MKSCNFIMRLLFFCLTGFLFFCRIKADIKDRYYPRYHLAPPGGWMNDPNGFCIFKKEYHLFYQYNPASSFAPGIANWGHAKSRDLFHWEHLPIAMYPDQDYDIGGVFSGSAIIENNTMYLMYTGNIYRPGEFPDHANHQALAMSVDGVNIKKYEKNPILIGEEHQPNFRDPKIWKHHDTYYAVIGSSYNNDTLGRIVLYASKDKLSWKQVSILGDSDGRLGYMWECPDFFELNGRWILLFSPQGVKPEGDKFRNLYQTGYFVGDFNYKNHIFTPTQEFQELDNGHDVYATQTLIDKSGRRIVVAWMDMWERNYPEEGDGWTGQMTMPRVLSLNKEGRIIQKPVDEVMAVRGKIIHLGPSLGGTIVPLHDNSAEVCLISSHRRDLNLFIESQNSGNTTVHIRYDSQNGSLILDRGGKDGIRRTEYKPKRSLKLKIYIDASSIEVFAGEGEVTFTSRFFPDEIVQVRLGRKSAVRLLLVREMRRTVFLNTN